MKLQIADYEMEKVGEYEYSFPGSGQWKDAYHVKKILIKWQVDSAGNGLFIGDITNVNPATKNDRRQGLCVDNQWGKSFAVLGGRPFAEYAKPFYIYSLNGKLVMRNIVESNKNAQRLAPGYYISHQIQRVPYRSRDEMN